MMAVAVRLPETPSTPSEQFVAFMETQITPVAKGTASQGLRTMTPFQPGSQIVVRARPQMTRAAPAVVDKADEHRGDNERQGPETAGVERHEDQAGDAENRDEDQTGAERFADALLRIDRERAAPVGRQARPESRQGQPGRQGAGGEAHRGQKKE
jgi:hypothetical protein